MATHVDTNHTQSPVKTSLIHIIMSIFNISVPFISKKGNYLVFYNVIYLFFLTDILNVLSVSGSLATDMQKEPKSQVESATRFQTHFVEAFIFMAKALTIISRLLTQNCSIRRTSRDMVHLCHALGYPSFSSWQHVHSLHCGSATVKTQTTQCKSWIKRVNNVHMVSAPEGAIPFSLCYCEQAKWRHDVTNEPGKTGWWIMKHNIAFCNRKNKRWNHQQAREERVKESKQWLNDQKLAERVSVSLQGTLIYPQVKVRFQAQCNYSWGCQFDINAASRNSLIGLRGESEPENILTF